MVTLKLAYDDVCDGLVNGVPVDSKFCGNIVDGERPAFLVHQIYDFLVKVVSGHIFTSLLQRLSRKL